MKQLVVCVLIGIFSLTGCDIPNEKEIARECQEILDEERPKIVAEITAECADLMNKALDRCEASCKVLMDQAVTDVTNFCSTEIQKVLAQGIRDILEEIGCVEDENSAFGWACSETNLCSDPTPTP